jgi:Fe-S-cluster containining protein
MRRRRKRRPWLADQVRAFEDLRDVTLGVGRFGGTRRYIKSKVFIEMKQHAACRGCDGICCYSKNMNVEVTPPEFHTRPGRYKLQWHPAQPWRSRWPWHKQAETDTPRFRRCRAFAWLAKKSNGACIYFNQKEGKCGIYPNRPISCRGWFCGRETHMDYTWRELLTREKRDAEKDQTHVENNAGDLVEGEAVEDGKRDPDQQPVDSLLCKIRRICQESVGRSGPAR